MTPPRSPLVPAVLVGLLALLWLDHINPPFALTNDGVRDQLLARDCTTLGRCHMVGANASIRGFHHGPVWLDLLIGVRLLGGDTAQQRTTVIALMALSAATLFVVVWYWLRPSIAIPASVIFVGALGADTYPSLLINPSITALPDLLTVAGVLCYGLSARRRYLVVAAFALGAAISVHIGSLTLAVPLVAIIGLMQDRPWRALTGSAGIILLTYGLTSSGALRANAIALAQPARLLPACVAGAVLIALCLRSGPSFRRLGATPRTWIIGVLLVMPFAAGVAWLVWREHHFVTFMYLHPIVASAAVLIAAIATLPFELAARWNAQLRWIPSGVFVGAAVIGVACNLIHWPPAVAASAVAYGWSAPEARAITTQAIQRGWQYEDVLFRVQSRACRELLTGMSIAAPAPTRRDQRMAQRALQVVKASASALPRLDTAHTIVALDPENVAIMRDVDSWLQPEDLRACRVAVGGTPQCAPAHRKVIDAIGLERFLFITRAFPEIHSLALPPPYVATYEIPVTARADGAHDLAVIDAAPKECAWHVARVEGVSLETSLPSPRVRLRAAAGDRGLVVVERVYGGAACAGQDSDLRYPPCFFEAAPDDALMDRMSTR